MAYGDSFKQFLIDQQIPCKILTVGDSEPFIFLDSISVNELIHSSYARKVNNGGLILGNFHTQGGIHMLQSFENGFQYVGEMEGYEYLFSPSTTKKYIEKILELNKSVIHDKESEPKPFIVPRHIRKVDLTNLHFQIMVMPAEPHYVLNRTATEKYLTFLDEMNDDRKLKGLWRLLRL